MEYYTEFNRPPIAEANPGSPYVEYYEDVIDEKTGEKTSKLIKKENVYEKIQAYKESSLLSNMIKRFENGDLNALNRKPVDNYGDTTILPKTIHELKNMVDETNKKIEALPVDLQEKVLNGEAITKEDVMKAYNLTEEQTKEETTNE